MNTQPIVKRGKRRARLVIVLVAGVAAFLAGLVPRLAARERLVTDAKATAERLPLVATVRPHRAPGALDVTLPGTVEAIQEAAIYARTDGYLKARYVDIGDRVSAGQLLAEIDTPEVDQQLNQARAAAAESQANAVKLESDRTLARSTLARYRGAGTETVSKQQIDEKTAAAATAEKALDAARATVNAAQANVKRLLELTGFQKVYAPFDGIITSRSVDSGALISAGSGGGARELFRLARVDTLRIRVFVPQSYAPAVEPQQIVDVTVRGVAGGPVHGTVSRTAGALDPASRTLLTEVQVPNANGALLSGSYATVRFHVARSEPPILIPGRALIVDTQGVRVAAVGSDGTLRYKPVEMGRDYGDEVEVVSGVDTTDVLAINLAANLADGTRVEIARATAPTTLETKG